MKLLAILAVTAALCAPAYARQTISDTDHPNIPNCTIVGPNADNCENLTLQAIYGHNGIPQSDRPWCDGDFSTPQTSDDCL